MKVYGQLLILISFLVFFAGCAKVGSPVGGPKDTKPPKVVKSTPDNGATNFDSKRIEITFDEFPKFKDKEKEFVTSPPFNKKPEVYLRYKTVVIDFRENLLPDRTYSLKFGNSITDNNEGNPIRDYEFVFSTGKHIDSLSFEGKVVNAFNHQPDKERLFVMLYDVVGDSVPMKYLPAYTSKTNEKGFFRINHIKADTFTVVAIKDANNNNFYESNEEVAFSDSLLYLDARFYNAPDTAAARDTATSDSAYYSRFKPQIMLYSFINENKKQYLTSKERKQANQLSFTFNVPVDTFKISLEGYQQDKTWFFKEESANRDTFTLWITDTTLVKRDTLQTVLVYPMPDSLNVLRPRYDSLSMVYKAPQQRRQKQNEVKPAEKLAISTNAREGFDLNDRIAGETSAPIENIDLNKIIFTYTEDSIYKPVKYTLRRDTSKFRRFVMDFTPVPNAQYSLVFDSLAIRSIYNTYNDSTGITFTSQKDDYYGAIKATISNVPTNVILQVIDDKENVLKAAIITKDQLVTFNYLSPGKYRLKAIYDRNASGKWDTGDLVKRIQPEKVEYFINTIDVRSNWDVEISWKLGEEPVTVK